MNGPSAAEPLLESHGRHGSCAIQRQSSMNKSGSQPFCPNVRQNLILHPMALKHRQVFALLEQRSPFLCGEERSGELDQPA